MNRAHLSPKRLSYTSETKANGALILDSSAAPAGSGTTRDFPRRSFVPRISVNKIHWGAGPINMLLNSQSLL